MHPFLPALPARLPQLSKVMELQRNITQRHHPLIRHVAASPPTPFWPAVIVV